MRRETLQESRRSRRLPRALVEANEAAAAPADTGEPRARRARRREGRRGAVADENASTPRSVRMPWHVRARVELHLLNHVSVPCVSSLRRALVRLCQTPDEYDVALDARPPSKRAIAAAFRVLPSSRELLALYATALRSGIVFPWYAEDVTLYAASDLLERQEGYRWAVCRRDELLPGWNAEWVVIGHVMGADPIIASPRERGTPLYWAMHGAGKWKPVRAAASLAQGAEARRQHLGRGLRTATRGRAGNQVEGRYDRRTAIAPWLPS